MSNQADNQSVQRTAASISVQAPVQACYDVGVDVLAYPQWADGIEEAAIESVDDQGRPATVRFQAEALGRRSNYVLGYDLSGAPHELRWHLVSGDLAREIAGRYLFTDMTEDGGPPTTEVDYELTIDLAVPLPGFVKRRAEDKIVRSALAAFKQRVENLEP